MSIKTDHGLMIDLIDHAQPYPQDNTERLLERIFAAARPGAVFGTPITSGAFTVITASEISSGGGFGSGRATLPKLPGRQAEAASPTGETGGSGGGGGASGRPIAAIVIGPDGVSIKPIFDANKIILSAIAALGAMLALALRRRGRAR